MTFRCRACLKNITYMKNSINSYATNILEKPDILNNFEMLIENRTNNNTLCLCDNYDMKNNID